MSDATQQKPQYSKRASFPTAIPRKPKQTAPTEEQIADGTVGKPPSTKPAPTAEQSASGATSSSSSTSSTSSLAMTTPIVIDDNQVNAYDEAFKANDTPMYGSGAVDTLTTNGQEILNAMLAALEIQTPRITIKMRQLERMPLYYNVVENDLARYLVQGGLGIRYASYASGAKRLNAAEEITLRDVGLAHARLMGLYMDDPVVAGCKGSKCPNVGKCPSDCTAIKKVCTKCMLFTLCDACASEMPQHLQSCGLISKLWIQTGIHMDAPIVDPDDIQVIHTRDYRPIQWKSPAELAAAKNLVQQKREAFKAKRKRNMYSNQL